MGKPKIKHIFVKIDSATIARKQCLPSFITWRDILFKGLLSAEGEQRKITDNLNKKENAICQ